MPENRLIIIIASTTGDGEVPENGARFFRKLKLAAHGQSIKITNDNFNQWLNGTYFSVLGLGDSNYSQFNKAARDIYDHMLSLGAKPFMSLELADDATGFVYLFACFVFVCVLVCLRVCFRFCVCLFACLFFYACVCFLACFFLCFCVFVCFMCVFFCVCVYL